MERSLVLAALLFVSTAVADDQRHFELAQRFDTLSGAADKAALVSAFVPEIIRANPSLAPYQKEFHSFMVEVMESEEYRLGKARAYMKLFSEAELEQLIVLVQSPAYLIMQNKRNEMSVLLIQNITEVITKRLPEFQRQVKEK